jgi:hypothetical protein
MYGVALKCNKVYIEKDCINLLWLESEISPKGL